jgi:hypothetical protein
MAGHRSPPRSIAPPRAPVPTKVIEIVVTVTVAVTVVIVMVIVMVIVIVMMVIVMMVIMVMIVAVVTVVTVTVAVPIVVARTVTLAPLPGFAARVAPLVATSAAARRRVINIATAIMIAVATFGIRDCVPPGPRAIIPKRKAIAPAPNRAVGLAAPPCRPGGRGDFFL